jgi:hypothetical protein
MKISDVVLFILVLLVLLAPLLLAFLSVPLDHGWPKI